jgi:hypothetical protein
MLLKDFVQSIGHASHILRSSIVSRNRSEAAKTSVMHERALLLNNYLSLPMVGHCLSVYGLSSPICYHVLRFDYPVLYLHLLKASLFSHFWVFVLLLSGLPPPPFMSERIGLRKLFTKLSYCRTLRSFFRVQMVNCSQRSYIMLLSKLTPSTTKPPTRLEGVLPMGPHLATDGRAHCLHLVLYPERVTS